MICQFEVGKNHEGLLLILYNVFWIEELLGQFDGAQFGNICTELLH